MKIAFITDLHANRESVSAVMAHAHAQGAQRYAFLGDFVGYGADPGWVIDLVREHVAQGAHAVLGNHDAAVLRGAYPSMVADARHAVDWTRSRLSRAQFAFLADLPLTVTEDDRLYVHANAVAPGDWGYVVGSEEAALSLQATPQRFTFCGHMHEPALFHMSASGRTDEFEPVAGMPLSLAPPRRWLVIPGSAGQPRDGNPAACYATFETEDTMLTFHRVGYDHEAAAQRIRAAGLPASLAERLRRGD